MPDSILRPRIYYGWWIVVLLFFTLMNTAGNGFYTFSVYIPRLIEEFGCSTSSIMLTTAVWSIVFGFSNPIVGTLMYKHGVKKVFIYGVISTGVLMLLMSFITQLWHLFLLNTLFGFTAAATILVPCQTLITTWFSKRRGIAMALMMMGIGAGGFTIPQVAAWLIEQFGWRHSFQISAVINYVVVLPPLYLFLKNGPADVGQPLDGTSKSTEQVNIEHMAVGISASRAVRTKLFWLILGVYILQLFCMSGITINVQNFAEKEMSYSIHSATHFMAFALLVTIPSRFLFGWLCDLFDPKKLIAVAGVFILTGSVVLWSVTELSLVNNYWAISMFALFQGLGIAGNAVVLPILVGRCFGEREFSKILGFIMSGFAVGSLLGPFIMGKIFDVTGTYEKAFFLSMIVAAISTLIALMIQTNSFRSSFSET